MSNEERSCQNCKNQFTIEPDDFVFYEKFGVLAPNMCPLCRAQRRLAFRNERVFYKRPCDKCKRSVISMYSPNKSYTVWCYDCWFSDDWDAQDYAREYDSTKPFFEQFGELWKAVPKVALIYVHSVNSEYVNISADNKNCYMIVESSNNEGCIHCYWIQRCRDSVDTSFSHQTELAYESDDCYDSYRLLYSKGCHNSRESYFCLDCRDVSNCIGCVNLRSKQYHIFNQPYSKSDYEAFLKEARLDAYSGVEKFRRKFQEFLAAQPRKFAEIVNAPRSTGNYMKDAKNCRSCFHCYDAEDSKYGVHVWRNAKDCMDCDTAGRTAERIYNSINSGLDTAHHICSAVCWSSTFMTYSYYSLNCNHCFGCVGLRKKDYYILNKQYLKEEYEKLTGHIIGDMQKRGEYGEFFPPEISAFGYNESAAQEQFPLTKERALAQGFLWEDYPRGTFGKETISWESFPDSIKDVFDFDPTKAIFACAECKKNYLVTPNEFGFYRRLEIPIPRLCPDCRHTRRFQARGPNRLWHRRCMCDYAIYNNTVKHMHHPEGRCPNEFETSYPPDRPEIVYCEACYNAEVA